MEIKNVIDAIGFRPAFDTLAILFLFLAAFFYGISIGVKRMLIILVSTYFAFALIQVFPFWNILTRRMGGENIFFYRVGLYLILLVFIYMVLSGTRLRTILSFPPKGLGSWWQIFMLSLLQVGLLVAVLLSFSPDKANIELTPLTTRLFSNSTARFLWFILPIVFLGFLKREKNGNG